MAGWHHRLDGHDFKSTLGVGDDVSLAWLIHGVASSQTRLSDRTELNSFLLRFPVIFDQGNKQYKIMFPGNNHTEVIIIWSDVKIIYLHQPGFHCKPGKLIHYIKKEDLTPGIG